MARPERARRIGCIPLARSYAPAPSHDEAPVELRLDELEALRLIGLMELSHTDAADRMGVSRPTFARTLEQAQHKVAKALLQGRRLHIGDDGPMELDAPHGGVTMKIAVAITDEGTISSHLGQSQGFRILEVSPQGARLVEERSNPHRGHGHRGKAQAHGCGGQGCGGHGHAHGHGHGCGGDHHASQGGTGGCGGGPKSWLDEVFFDCDAAIARGMGSRAAEGLRRRGVRPILLDRELSVEEAVALYAGGRL